MSKQVVIQIESGNFEEGFAVSLYFGENGQDIDQDYHCPPLPPNPTIPKLYNNWKINYDNLGGTRAINTHPGITNRSILEECHIAAEALRNAVNEWLCRPEFGDIRGRILGRLKDGNEDHSVRVIFDTHKISDHPNYYLRRLPWDQWDLFQNQYFLPNAEYALLAQYNRPTPALNQSVKILAVFGSSEGGLQLEEDRSLLQTLEEHGAEITFIPEEGELTYTQLHDTLWQGGWDIIFYAGHSANHEIQINSNNNFSVHHLKEAFKAAAQTAKLAIFNSCDGLGIADFLASWGFPNTIVMREPVPDAVARRFLKLFLEEFVNQTPLYPAVRKARKQLQGMENDVDDNNLFYPGASWLPIIVQNPAQPELRWLKPELEPTQVKQKQLRDIIQIEIVVKLGLLVLSVAVPLIAYKSTRQPISLDPNLTQHFSFGEKRLLQTEAWLGDDDYQKCIDNLSLKDTGIKAFKNGYYSKAIDDFKSFLKKTVCPVDPETHIYLANADAAIKKNPIKIAVVVPLGSVASDAQEILRGVALAQNKINRNGGINGRPLQIQIVNDDTSQDRNLSDLAQDVAAYLTHNQEIVAVVGHLSSDATQVAGDEYAKDNLVVISPTSTAIRRSHITPEGMDFSNTVFRTASNDSVAIQDLVKFMQKLGYQKAVIYYDADSGYSRSLKRELKNNLEETGGEVVHECNLANPVFSASWCVEKAMTSEADVMLIFPSTESYNEAEAVISLNYNPSNPNHSPLPLLGGDAMYKPKTLSLGEKVKGMVIAVPWYPELRKHPNSNFLNSAEKLFGTQSVNWRTLTSYDATMAIAEGLKRLGINPTRERLKAVLQRHQNFSAEGATATIKFDQSGDRVVDSNNDHELGVLVEVQKNPKSGKYEFFLVE